MPPIEPDLMGLIPKVVVVTDLEGGVTEEPLPEAKTPTSSVPSKVVT